MKIFIFPPKLPKVSYVNFCICFSPKIGTIPQYQQIQLLIYVSYIGIQMKSWLFIKSKYIYYMNLLQH